MENPSFFISQNSILKSGHIIIFDYVSIYFSDFMKIWKFQGLYIGKGTEEPSRCGSTQAQVS